MFTEQINCDINAIKLAHDIDVVPVKYFGEILENLYMDRDGYIYSTRRSWHGKKIKPYTLPSNKGAGKYPRSSFVLPDGKKTTLTFHCLVGHTLVPYRKPAGISQKDWNDTPESVKMLIYKNAMELNHIDENHKNFHPSNLEWVTKTQNREAYHNNPVRYEGSSYFSKEHLYRKAA